jgi:hypothetical protein
VALIGSGMPVMGMSRRDMYSAINASTALDIILVTMLRMYSTAERGYAETRDEYIKQVRKLAVESDPRAAEKERVRKNVIAMAKYQKAR